MGKFEIFYPGQYSAEDKEAIDAYFARLEAVNTRGDIDPADLVSGKLAAEGVPGVGTGFMDVRNVKDYEARFDALNYAPDSPLHLDPEYAKKAGYETAPCIPLMSTAGEFWEVTPPSLRNFLVVSGLSHVWNFHRPVYPGDTLYSIADWKSAVETTPGSGSEYRTFAISGRGRVFNQRGELVSDAYDCTSESSRRYLDPSKRGLPMLWESPKWWERPRHYYTDADWEFIRDVWSKQAVRGSEPLYWEDVNVGDEPPWYAEGPVTTLDQVKYHGLGEIGSPSLRKVLSDPFMAGMMQKDARDGIYYHPAGALHLDDGRDPDRRAAFYNFMPVNHAATMLENWMGDKGWLQSIGWRIMTVLPGYGDAIPEVPDADYWLDKVPYMKGRRAEIHGLVGDLMLLKSYVCGKYEKDGGHFADLVWWGETIEGQVFQEGAATVRLPSRG